MRIVRNNLHFISVIFILIVLVIVEIPKIFAKINFYTLGSVAAVFMAFFTLLYVFETRKMAIEIKRQREIMEEPVVSVKIIPDEKSPILLNLVIKNTGGGPAYDVSIAFDPDLPYKDSTLNNLKLIRKIPLLDKGEKMEIFFDSSYRYFSGDNPKTTVANIQYYKIPNYENRSNEPFKRKIEIDIEERKGTLFVAEKGIHELVKEIEELKETILIYLDTKKTKAEGKAE